MSQSKFRPLSALQKAALASHIDAATAARSGAGFARYPLTQDPSIVLDVARCADFPAAGIRTAISRGLCDFDWSGLSFPDRIELVQCWTSGDVQYEQLLMVVAEVIITSGRLPKPGAVYLDAARIANLPRLAATLPHALIMFPLLWSDGLIKASVDGVDVWFLQVVPITDAERAFIKDKGFKTFTEVLSHQVMDLHRTDRVSHV